MKEKIIEYIKDKKINDLKVYLDSMSPKDIALVFEELNYEYMLIVFRLLSKEVGAEVFSEIGHDTQEDLIKSLNDRELKDVMDELFTDDAVDLIGEMPANLVNRILKAIPMSERKVINQFLSYPEESAGSIMTNEFIDLKSSITVKEAFEKIKKEGINSETIYTCYVLDKTRKLIGLVSVRDLILADSNQKVEELMNTNIIKGNTLEDRETVARRLQKYDFLALPIVDNEDRLVGIVTVDDAMEVLQNESTEDFAKMAAVKPLEDKYFETSVFVHAKNRIVWLIFLMISAIITGSIITHYEEAFAAVPVLVAFIPMLMGTGGNCGSQASTLIIRGLATDEIKLKDIFRALFKEIRVALVVGTTLAIIIGVGASVIYKSIRLGIVLGLSLICTVILSKSLGCLLPMLAKRLKLDPAIMAAPLITTIVDTCSVLIYFMIATNILGL